MIDAAIPTLVLIGLAAVLAPILAEWSRRFLAVPEVVIQIVLGILLGPFVLNLAHPNNIVKALSDLGLTYLMFLAGTELEAPDQHWSLPVLEVDREGLHDAVMHDVGADQHR